MVLLHSDICFDSERHVYSLGGMVLPSVSAVLSSAGLRTSYSNVPEPVLEKARARGVAVHAYTESIDNGDDPVVEDPTHTGYVTAYRSFVRDSGYESIVSEIIVCHAELLYCGMPDAVGRLNERRTIVDRKATAVLDKKGTAIQCGAYALAWDSMHADQPIEQIAGLHLKRDGSYQLVMFDIEEAKRVWLCAYEVYRFKRRK